VNKNVLIKIITVILLLFIYTNAGAAKSVNAAASAYTFSSTYDARRFTTLTNETRCIVCQFQNLAESNAPIAVSMRDKIFQLINEKKSDDEIKTFLVKRYGEVILLKPRFNPMTYLLWLFPLGALLSFAFILRKVYVIK
jgi:cytochrome c-type biogenesis protein CcmH